MTRLMMLGSLCLLAIAAGCGSSVDHDQAVTVMSSALTGTVAADGQVVNVDWTKAGGQVDVALTNHAGSGTAQITGTVVRNGSVTTTTVDVAFQNWNDPIHNVTLDGTLHEAGTFSAPLPLMGDVTVTGALASTGGVVATVDFDLHGTYSPTGFAVKGDVGGNTVDVAVAVP